jgi:hypothetical protein
VVGKELGVGELPKEMREVIAPLLEQGWALFKEGHKGRLVCPCGCSSFPVAGTPRSAGTAAKRLKREALRCPLPADDPRRTLRGMDRSGTAES